MKKFTSILVVAIALIGFSVFVISCEKSGLCKCSATVDGMKVTLDDDGEIDIDDPEAREMGINTCSDLEDLLYEELEYLYEENLDEYDVDIKCR